MKPNSWSREEILLAFYLYCTVPSIPGGHSDPDDFPEIKAVADYIGRTFGAVLLKMCNLRNLDPSDPRQGYSNGGKADKALWGEYMEKGTALFEEAQDLMSDVMSLDSLSTSVKLSDIEEQYMTRKGYDVLGLTKQRRGQDFFRKAVCSSYQNQCCITGINRLELLTASHIKPWASCTDSEKINPSNGLCLNRLHDVAFDLGYISFDENLCMLVSSEWKKRKVDDTTKDFIVSGEGRQLILPKKKLFKPSDEFMEFHRDVIFKH